MVPHSVLHGGGGGQLRAIDLELLISGLPHISLDDWKAHTAGALARDPAHAELAAWFWDVVAELGEEGRAKLLSFACGSSRLPAEGFAGLRPPFNVQVEGEASQLPSAHTCFNQLCLPAYTSKEALEGKLKVAIENNEGFGAV